MSTAESVPSPSSAAEPGDPQRDRVDIEAVARRALGIAMNQYWGGAEIAPLPPLPQSVVDAAQALLRERVPSGHERELALTLLAQCAVAEPTQRT